MALYCDSNNVIKVDANQDAFKAVHKPGELVPLSGILPVRQLR
jgi:hypothetical protein